MIPNDLKYPTTVVAKYGHNKVLNKPFELEQVRVATEEDKKKYFWGK